MMAGWERHAAEAGAWLLACAWCGRVYGALKYMPGVPNLAAAEWDRTPGNLPELVVVVPARNEATNIAATVESLLAQDYVRLQVLAVDDRSTDETGNILDGCALRNPGKLQILHVTELPEGWLGKTNAMQLAVQNSRSEYLLFTDADVVFDETILRRAVAYAERTKAAHLVIAPTPLVHAWGEGVMLGFLQVLGLWAVRPWRVADPKAKHDAIGVGAFNMVRRDELEAIGGLEMMRLAIIEDAALGIRMKAAGFAQRLVFAPGMVRVHWAAGGRGIVRVMTKNLFSGVGFQPVFLLAACIGIAVLFLLPLAGLAWWPTVLPALIVLCCVVLQYRTLERMTSIKPRYAWTFPLGAVVFLWALLRSMLAAWVQGGVVWRGTHYPLKELRKHNSPWRWRQL